MIFWAFFALYSPGPFVLGDALPIESLAGLLQVDLDLLFALCHLLVVVGLQFLQLLRLRAAHHLIQRVVDLRL